MLRSLGELQMSIGEILANAVELPEGVREGATLSGKYLIGPILGAGAMGIVVAARHLLLNEDVAIKFLVAGRWDQPDAVQRFVQEARSAIRIQSEHVVRVLDVAVLEGGAPYIVMERLKGEDLASRLRMGGPMPVEQAVDFVIQACEAISESHRIGIIHRDLKPANLFILERDGAPSSIKVLDFGIAKSTHLVPKTVDLEGTLQSAQITQAQAILGSPFYMSPEQMESARDVDARTDIWALGVTLFEMVTGRPPFTGSSLVQVYSKMAAPEESGWRLALGRHPPGLEAIVARCLEWDRDRRFSTVREFASALAPFGSKRAGVSLRRMAVSPDASESNPGVEKLPALTPRRPGRVHVGRNLLAAMLAGFFGSAVFVLGSRPRSPSDASAPSAARLAPMTPLAPPSAPPGTATTGEAPTASAWTAPDTSLAASAPSPAPSPTIPAHAVAKALSISMPANATAKALSTSGKVPPAALLSAAPAPSAAVVANPHPSAVPSSAASTAPGSFIPEAIRALLEKRE